MATGFTTDELNASIDKFLLRQVQVTTLKTGSRNTTGARDTVYDLITASFLLRPDSFFYVVWLASNKLKGLVTAQLDALAQIDAAGPGVSRPAKRINSTSELTNARAAMLDINAGLNARSNGVRGSISPAVDRFRRSVGTFVSTELVKNVVENGQVTDTGDGLKAKIRTVWTDAISRHAQIVALAQGIGDALSQLDAVNLPQSAIQDIASRIQTRLVELETTMAGTQGVEQSRQALLDLMTMRTLLTAASSFRVPQLTLAPLTGDSNLLSFIDSAGQEAFIEGTVSGPFNYNPGAGLTVSINSGASTPTITLPRTSRAQLSSGDLSAAFPSPAGAQAAVVLNLGGTVVYNPPAYASGPVAAADLNANLPGIGVTWDAGTSTLIFQSLNNTDISRLRFLQDTGVRAAFVAWVFGGGLITARSNPPSAAEIVTRVAETTPLLSAEIDQTFFDSFTGLRTPTLGEEAILWNKKDEGLNLIADGTTTVTSPTKNFTRLGVRAGMAIEITAPPLSAGQYSIESVAGNKLVLSAPVAATGAATYFLGPDYRTIPVGARVQITSTGIQDNSAFYRVLTPQVARVTLDRNIPQADTSLISVISSSKIILRALGTTTSSGVGVTVASLGATALGFAVTPSETTAGLTVMEIAGSGVGDFLARGVRAGDRVLLTSPTAVSYIRLVDSVTTSRITFTQELPHETGNWTFVIQSARVYQYDTLTPFVAMFLDSTFVANFASLDALIGRLIRGAKYTGQISAAVSTYRVDLTGLQASLVSYAVPAERIIDLAIRTMREQGFDRATDLFLGLQIEEFFSMDPDGVSYSTWLVRKAATAARLVAPVSKLSKSPVIRQEWRPVSFQTNPLDPRNTDPHGRQ